MISMGVAGNEASIHEVCTVYYTQDTSRMETTRVMREEEADTRIIVKEENEDPEITVKEE